MKKYKFKLEPLLFQRQTIEELTQQKLSGEIHTLKQLQAVLEDAFQSYNNHKSKQHSVKMSPADIQMHMNFTTVLQERLDEAREKVRDQNKVITEIKKELLEQHKQTKIVEHIKDKDIEKYKEELKKAETIEMDEFTSIRQATKIMRSRKN